jgi:hypothetical protein
MDITQLIQTVGFPIAVSCAVGWVVWYLIKYGLKERQDTLNMILGIHNSHKKEILEITREYKDSLKSNTEALQSMTAKSEEYRSKQLDRLSEIAGTQARILDLFGTRKSIK